MFVVDFAGNSGDRSCLFRRGRFLGRLLMCMCVVDRVCLDDVSSERQLVRHGGCCRGVVEWREQRVCDGVERAGDGSSDGTQYFEYWK